MRLDILAEHAGEAMFLFEHRQRALASLVLDRDFLRDLDERLVAHLDGLLVAGDAGWDVAAALAGADEPAGPFVTAAVALMGATPAALDALEVALIAAAPAALDAMSCALRLWPQALTSGRRVLAWLGRPEARLRAAGITALTAAGRPLAPALLTPALEDGASDPALLAAALAGAGQSRDRRHLPAVLALASHADASVRGAALQAAPLLDARAARDQARERLENDADRAGAARVLGVLGEVDDAAALARRLAVATPAAERAILLALGNLGLAEAIAPLLDAAAGEGVRARVAGFALGRILGAGAHWRPRPPAPAAPATAEGDAADDASGEPWTVDHELPLWLVEPIAETWKAVSARVGAGVRVRAGAALVPGVPGARAPLGIQADEELESALAAPAAPLRDLAALAVPDLFAWRAPTAAPAPAARSRRA